MLLSVDPSSLTRAFAVYNLQQLKKEQNVSTIVISFFNDIGLVCSVVSQVCALDIWVLYIESE